jgi:putative membrane protein
MTVKCQKSIVKCQMSITVLTFFYLFAKLLFCVIISVVSFLSMYFFKKYLLHIIVGIAGFFLADYFLDTVTIEDNNFLLIAGITLGSINFFIRPLIKFITLPLRIITLGLFSFFINIAIVWFVQAVFQEVQVVGFLALLYTVLIIWVLEVVTNFSIKK